MNKTNIRIDNKIRIARKEDIAKILCLMHDIFTETHSQKLKELNAELYQWLYQDNPSGGSITFISEFNGKIIGHYPSILTDLKVRDRVCKAGIVLDLLTHKDFRRRGMFKSLQETSMKELSRSGVDFCLAFPNQLSLPGFLKMGWKIIATIPLLVKPLILPVLSCKKKEGRVAVSEADEFDERFDTLFKDSTKKIPTAVIRDRKYLNWRYRMKPAVKYRLLIAQNDKELLGYIVLRIRNIFAFRTGLIMDFLVKDGSPEILGTLLEKAIDYLRKEGACTSIAILVKDSFYFSLFKNLGFMRLSERFNPRRFTLVGKLINSEIDREFFYDYRNWFITLGDWDVF